MTTHTSPHSESTPVRAGFVGRIPIRNIWLLMLYSSALYRELGGRTRAVEENPDDIADLVAEMLCHAVDKRVRRNLSFGYRRRDSILNRVRGRIDVLRTERHQLLLRGLVACRHDEISVDTPRNRFIKAALVRVSGLVARADLRHRCRSLALMLERLGVLGERPTWSELSADRIGRHDASDRFMIQIARLAFDLALPTEEQGTYSLPSPERERHWLRRLFEKGVAGLYTVALAPEGWSVQPSRTLSWQIEASTAGIDAILPHMRTDIYLENDALNRRIIVDTKFTSILTKGWYRESSLKTGYIYQMYAYLRSQEHEGDPRSRMSEGVLLHPAVGQLVDESALIQQHRIRFVTVDMTLSAKAIRDRLADVIRTVPQIVG